MVKRIFILEDNEERIAEMQRLVLRQFPNSELAIHLNAPAAICFLRNEFLGTELISLDHDLEPSANPEFATVDPGTGRDVANVLATFHDRCPVIIHSTNVPAAIGMEMELADAGWETHRITPYGDLDWISEVWFPLMISLVSSTD